MLLDVQDKEAANTILTLQDKEGVVAIDPLEGHPNFLLIVEAPDRQKLVESLTPVLSSIERITKDMRLVLIRENSRTSSFFNTGNLHPLSLLRPANTAPRMTVNSSVS